jgi:hypothetical protein
MGGLPNFPVCRQSFPLSLKSPSFLFEAAPDLKHGVDETLGADEREDLSGRVHSSSESGS